MTPRDRSARVLINLSLGSALVLTACSAGPPRALGTGTDLLPDTTLPAPGLPPDPPVPGDVPGFTHGVVTTSEPLAAEVGARVLAEGGNAVDAAAAVLFMLNVVEPQSSGIGGGGFMLIHLAAEDETVVLDYRERAPAAATPRMFASQSKYSLRATSGYSVGVPGAVRGVARALATWGTITLAEALQPAIEAAEHGFPIGSRLAHDIGTPGLDAERIPIENPGKRAYDVARAVFRPGGKPLKRGESLIQPDLATTFKKLAAGGPDAFYDCDHPAGIARAILEAQHHTRRSNPGGKGRMTCADLRSYEALVLPPIHREYRGYDIVTAPPPASGVTLLQMLGMLERFPLGDTFAGFGTGRLYTLNVMLEAMRLAHADRALWVGDQGCPKCLPVPVEGLLADAYLAERSTSIKVGMRLGKVLAGDPRLHDPRFPKFSHFDSTPAAVQGAGETRGDATHFTIVDRDGNIVSCTTSIADVWGSGLMVCGHGFLLNDAMTDFNPVPRLSADPERHDPGADDVAPFKRPRSSMAPTLVFLDGAPVAAYGSPGGGALIDAVLNVTVALIDHRKTLRQAVLSPRISLIGASNTEPAHIEPGLDRQVRKQLSDLDYKLRPDDALGAVQAILTVPQSGEQYGAADPRRLGAVTAPDRP